MKREVLVRDGAFPYGRVHYRQHKEEALRFVRAKVEHFSAFYGFSYNTIRVKNQRSCWGSCSRKGNLNFNYKILLLPPDLQDYVIVHELCHLREMNHSARFWALVGQAISDPKGKRRELRKISKL